jgi:hypothetical protein
VISYTTPTNCELTARVDTSYDAAVAASLTYRVAFQRVFDAEMALHDESEASECERKRARRELPALWDAVELAHTASLAAAAENLTAVNAYIAAAKAGRVTDTDTEVMS